MQHGIGAVEVLHAEGAPVAELVKIIFGIITGQPIAAALPTLSKS
jgi:hypothetical protein